MNTFNAARAAWNEKAFVPDESFGWDLLDNRNTRYVFNRAYYNNVIYSSLTASSAYMKSNQKLYRHIRGIYNPVFRQCEIYVAKVFGGALDLDSLTKGAIPIAVADQRLRDAIKQVWLWSNWGTQKSTFVRNGAMLGDTAIKIIDDRASQKVRMEVLDPGKIKFVETDAVGNVKHIVIEYERTDETFQSATSSFKKFESYIYTEEITQDSFRTFKDNEPFAYYENARGELVDEWPNEYGFVPVFLCQHRDMGLEWGASAFGAARAKIDNLNDLASKLCVQISKAITPIFFISGAQAEDQEIDTPTNANGEEMSDTAPLMYGPDGSSATPMVFPLDITAAAAYVKQLLEELEADMPELSMHRVRDSGQTSGVAVEMLYNDASDRIIEARGNYNACLVRAQMAAVTIGGINRYRGFEAYNINSYANGDLEHYIAERPVIETKLSQQERIDFWLQSEAPNAVVWKELGATEDQIAAWTVERERAALNIEKPNVPQLPPGQTPPPDPAEFGQDEINSLFDEVQGLIGNA